MRLVPGWSKGRAWLEIDAGLFHAEMDIWWLIWEVRAYRIGADAFDVSLGPFELFVGWFR